MNKIRDYIPGDDPQLDPTSHTPPQPMTSVFQEWMVCKVLGEGVMFVAVTRIEGTWACYCGQCWKPGDPAVKSYLESQNRIRDFGAKVGERIARAVFHHIEDLREMPYAWPEGAWPK